MSPTTPLQRFYWWLERAVHETDPNRALIMIYNAVDVLGDTEI